MTRRRGRASHPTVRTRRAYVDPGPDDGYRVLVDRLWPRGLTRERAALDDWLRDVAPSNKLRRWFGHDPRRWYGFDERYRQELQDNPALERLCALAAHQPVTLVFGASDEEHNNAVVLKSVIEARLS